MTGRALRNDPEPQRRFFQIARQSQQQILPELIGHEPR
jgi:hypothetical protein